MVLWHGVTVYTRLTSVTERDRRTDVLITNAAVHYVARRKQTDYSDAVKGG